MRRVVFDDRAAVRFRRSLGEPAAPSWRGRIAAPLCAFAIFALVSHAGEQGGFLPRGLDSAVRDTRATTLRENQVRENSEMNPIHGAVMAAGVMAIGAVAIGAELQVPEQFGSISAALAASHPGDVISVGSGTFQVGSLTMPAHAVTISGRSSASETVLEGVEIAFLASSAERGVRDVTLRNFTGYGAIRAEAAPVRVERVVIEAAALHGVFLTGGARIEMFDSEIRGCRSGGYAYVNGTWNATRTRFVGNVNDNGVAVAHGYGGAVAFHIGSGGTFSDCEFLDNYAETGGAVGLSFSGSRVFQNCRFEGNASPAGAVWSTEFGASGVLRDSVLCGHSPADLWGNWVDGGGNQFYPKGCNPPCPADLVADHTVNGADMAIVLNFWGTDGSQFPGVDIDGDGIVSGSDLAAVLNAWGPCPQ